MQRLLTYVAAAAIIWLAGIEVLLDGRRSTADARMAVELAAETTRARAASILQERVAALQGEPGMRAVTLGLNDIASDASLIWPGDHVDMLLTQQLDPHAPAARRIFSETVLTDVRVIAIDRQLVEGATQDAADRTKHAHTLTVEVTSEQAERLSVALRLGKLALSVRSAGPAPPVEAAAVPAKSGTIWAGDVSPALGREATPVPGPVVRVWQGSADSKEFHF